MARLERPSDFAAVLVKAFRKSKSGKIPAAVSEYLTIAASPVQAAKNNEQQQAADARRE